MIGSLARSLQLLPSLSKINLSVHIKYVGPDRPMSITKVHQAHFGHAQSRICFILVAFPAACCVFTVLSTWVYTHGKCVSVGRSFFLSFHCFMNFLDKSRQDALQGVLAEW